MLFQLFFQVKAIIFTVLQLLKVAPGIAVLKIELNPNIVVLPFPCLEIFINRPFLSLSYC